MNTLWLISSLFEWVLLVLLVLIVAGILRYLGRVEAILRPVTGHRVSKYTPGERIKDFTAVDLVGTSWSRDAILSSGRNSLLIFASQGCQTCELLFKQLSSLLDVQALSGGWSLYIFLQASEADARHFLAANVWIDANEVKVMLDKGGGIFQEFGVNALPIGMAIDKAGLLIDQSINPHAGWLYEILDLPKPNFIGDAPGQSVPMIASSGNPI